MFVEHFFLNAIYPFWPTRRYPTSCIGYCLCTRMFNKQYFILYTYWMIMDNIDHTHRSQTEIDVYIIPYIYIFVYRKIYWILYIHWYVFTQHMNYMLFSQIYRFISRANRFHITLLLSNPLGLAPPLLQARCSKQCRRDVGWLDLISPGDLVSYQHPPIGGCFKTIGLLNGTLSPMHLGDPLEEPGINVLFVPFSWKYGFRLFWWDVQSGWLDW